MIPQPFYYADIRSLTEKKNGCNISNKGSHSREYILPYFQGNFLEGPAGGGGLGTHDNRRPGVYLLFRKVYISVPQVLVGPVFEFFVLRHLRAHQYIREENMGLRFLPLLIHLKELYVRFYDGIGIVVQLLLPNITHELINIEGEREILGTSMQIHRVGKEKLLCRGEVHLSNNLVFPFTCIDYNHVFRRCGPQAYAFCRISSVRPVPLAPGFSDVPLLLEVFEKLLHLTAEDLSLAHRYFEDGTFKMVYKHKEVVRIYPRRLWRLGKEVIRMIDKKLVGGRSRCHEKSRRGFYSSSRPAGLLPYRGYGGRKSGEHGGIEFAYIDPQLQGDGGDNAVDLPLPQPFLYTSTLIGKIPSTIGFYSKAPVVGIVVTELFSDVVGY